MDPILHSTYSRLVGESAVISQKMSTLCKTSRGAQREYIAPSFVLNDAEPFACCSVENSIVCLHPLMLLSKEQIPSMYLKKQRSMPPDLQLQFTKWLETTHHINCSSYTLIPYYQKLWADQAMQLRAQHFALAHEVAHLYLGYPLLTRIGFLIFLEITALCLVVATLGVIALSFHTFAISGSILTLIYFQARQNLETAADLLAVQTTQDPEGAIYFLNALKTSDYGWLEMLASILQIHPHPKVRISSIQNQYNSFLLRA